MASAGRSLVCAHKHVACDRGRPATHIERVDPGGQGTWMHRNADGLIGLRAASGTIGHRLRCRAASAVRWADGGPRRSAQLPGPGVSASSRNPAGPQPGQGLRTKPVMAGIRDGKHTPRPMETFITALR